MKKNIDVLQPSYLNYCTLSMFNNSCINSPIIKVRECSNLSCGDFFTLMNLQSIQNSQNLGYFFVFFSPTSRLRPNFNNLNPVAEPSITCSQNNYQNFQLNQQYLNHVYCLVTVQIL